MSNDICPFMSGPVCQPGYWSYEHKDVRSTIQPFFIKCQREKCVAWVPKDPLSDSFCLLIGDHPKGGVEK